MAYDVATQMDVQNCRRLLRMVGELHIRGYQCLRVIPHLYSLGTWRCGITYRDNVQSDHGALPCDWDGDFLPQHTSAAGRECFGWSDARHLTASRLAELFLERFPELSARGLGPDWEYAGWFVWMMHETYSDCLPVAQGEYLEIPPGGLITIGGRQFSLTPPPPGGGCGAQRRAT